MTRPKLSELQHRIMETLWPQGQASIREIHEASPQKNRPAYTTIQTVVYRLKAKKALRKLEKA